MPKCQTFESGIFFVINRLCILFANCHSSLFVILSIAKDLNA